MLHRRAGTSALMLAIVMASGCGGSHHEDAGPPPRRVEASISGQVIGLDGRTVAGADVVAGEAHAVTDGQGRFRLTGAHAVQWVTARHPRFLSRTRPAIPGSPVLLRLSPDDGATISLQFGGDVMFGRRFYDRNEDGMALDGLLRPGAGVIAHEALLHGVAPLLGNADVTAVNLETPLIPSPHYNTLKLRPDRFHATKEFAFASAPESAQALRRAGIDVVDLGNNHLFDARQRGIRQTLAALRRGGFRAGSGHFGAGRTEREAQRPAIVHVRGRSIAFTGCTTITGDDQPVSYVAAGDAKGGAARCDEHGLAARVAALRRRNEVVVVMVHGGYEYARAQSPNIRRLSRAARTAGATLVINHHPHVVGGLSWDGSALTAWTLGNLLFDQDVWPTFQSYLLTVDIRRGRVIRAYAEPLMLEDYRPRGIAGGLADHVAREAAGREPGPFVVENGGMESDLGHRAQRRQRRVRLRGRARTGTLFQLAPGSWLSGFSGPGDVRLGSDLLWVGSFEDEDVERGNGSAALWGLGPASFGRRFAHRGHVGARIERSESSVHDRILTPAHRMLVKPRSRLSLVGMVRISAAARPRLTLNLYPNTRGPSTVRRRVRLGRRDDRGWRAFRLDLAVPAGIVAAAPYFRLSPPARGRATVDVDDIALIQWVDPRSRPSLLYDWLLVRGRGVGTVRHDALPGAPARSPGPIRSLR